MSKLYCSRLHENFLVNSSTNKRRNLGKNHKNRLLFIVYFGVAATRLSSETR